MPPTGIPANAQARINANAQALMPDTCTFFAQIYTPDGVGGSVISTGATWTGPCRVDPFRPPQIEKEAYREALVSEFVLTVPPVAPLTQDIKIQHNGHMYDVVMMQDDHSQQAYKQAHIARVSPA